VSYAKAHLSAFPTQSLRGYPTQALRGLGATAVADQAKELLLAKAKQDFVAACDELVTGTRAACNRIMDNATILSASRTEEVCQQIKGNVEQGVAGLKRLDAKGVPFFVRKPEKAQELLATIQKNADDAIEDHKRLMIETGFTRIGGDFGFESLKEFIKQAVDKLLQIIQFIILTLLEGAVKAPVAGIAIAAAVAALVWYKFLR